MRIFIVISEVTFVKENYNGFLKELFTHFPKIHGLIVLKNNRPVLKIQALGLIMMGAKEIGIDLLKNTIKCNTKDHEIIANQYKIPTYYFKSANDADFINLVHKENIDLIVNARTRDIYKKKILTSPKLGCINIHHGILPKFRGTMCDLYALYENRSAGFSIHKMEKKIDQGDILKVVEVTRPEMLSKKEYLNFPRHIYESSKIEGKVLAQLLADIEQQKSLIYQFKNTTDNFIYSKNPDLKMIKRMKRKGMTL